MVEFRDTDDPKSVVYSIIRKQVRQSLGVWSSAKSAEPQNERLDVR